MGRPPYPLSVHRQAGFAPLSSETSEGSEPPVWWPGLFATSSPLAEALTWAFKRPRRSSGPTISIRPGYLRPKARPRP